jgi:hypothetical protein
LCGFKTTPVIVTSLGGATDHWYIKGATELYSLSKTGFQVYINRPNGGSLTTSEATSKKYHLEYLASPPVSSSTFCAGRTTKGSTNWQVHTPSSLRLDVDVASCGFKSTPIIISSIGGASSQWETTGANNQYYNTKDGFSVYVNGPGSYSIANANAWSWHINWIAMPPTISSTLCAGRTTPGSTNWVQHCTAGSCSAQIGSGTSLYLDVDISSCGFAITPTIVTSLGGDSNHWQTTGAAALYSASKTTFRVYVNGPYNMDVAKAKQWKWHMQWIASAA